MEVVQFISSSEKEAFVGRCIPMLDPEGKLGLDADKVNIEEVDLHWQIAYATTDIGTANGPLIKAVTLDLTASTANLAVQTQDPKMKGDAINAGDMLIGCYGLSARLAQGAVATIANARAILDPLEQTLFRISNGTNRRVELFGDSIVGTGSDILTDANATPGRGPLPNKRIRKFGAPFTIGQKQKLVVEHIIGKTTAWAAAFTLDVTMPALSARGK